jgi:RNA-directed DNA polymerase
MAQNVAALEDKIVQQVVVTILNQIHEEDFRGFSYGFRPGRSQHQALDSLYVAMTRKKVNWILDCDIRAFFDNLSHDWLLKFVQHRVADRRTLRLIQKWLKAGVMEEGEWKNTEIGTPRGSVASPLLANICLHYVFDLCLAQEVRARRRDCRPVRRRQGDGKPETFDFLGFTHIRGKARNGSYAVKHKTISKRMRAKLLEIKQQLRRHQHEAVAQTGQWLRSIVQGYFNYHAVPGNTDSLSAFRNRVIRLWRTMLIHRGQKHHLTWARMRKLADRWIPRPRVLHPYPRVRYIQDKSLMRKCRSWGSVRGGRLLFALMPHIASKVTASHLV